MAGCRRSCKADRIRIVAIERGEEHQANYKGTIEIIQQVDPAVVVTDYAFRPALDATLQQNRLHSTISPLAMGGLFGILRPYGKVLWKYPW
jgi:hypothetical protein